METRLFSVLNLCHGWSVQHHIPWRKGQKDCGTEWGQHGQSLEVVQSGCNLCKNLILSCIDDWIADDVYVVLTQHQKWDALVITTTKKVLKRCVSGRKRSRLKETHKISLPQLMEKGTRLYFEIDGFPFPPFSFEFRNRRWHTVVRNEKKEPCSAREHPPLLSPNCMFHYLIQLSSPQFPRIIQTSSLSKLCVP